MRKEITTGVICGLVAGAIDLIPMVIQKLPWNANLSALSMWIIIGFFIATTQVPLNAIMKGILIAILCFLPNSFIIGWNDAMSLIPIFIMTIILGGLLGFFIQKMTKSMLMRS